MKEQERFSARLLTALDGMRGRLQGDVLSSGLRYVHAEHESNSGVFPTDVRLALPQLDVGVPELQDPGAVDSARKIKCVKAFIGGRDAFVVSKVDAVLISHCFHVVLRLQRDLQDFGAVDVLLVAGGRDRFAGDAVHLVKGVRLQDALVSCTDENLQAERLLASVAM